MRPDDPVLSAMRVEENVVVPRRLKGLTIVGIILVILAGCSAPPMLDKPVAKPVPAGWVEPSGAEQRDHLDVRWWTVFKDPLLNTLEEQALSENPDLIRAVARVDEARALAGIAAANRTAAVSFDPSVTQARTSETDKLPPFFPINTTRFRAPVDTSYEIDAWHRVKNQVLANRRDAAVAEADAETVRWILTADVARTFYQLRTADAEIEVLTRSLAIREDSMKVQQTRLNAGLMNEVAVTRARFETATTRVSLEGIQRQRAALWHALAVLTGRTLGNAEISTTTPMTALPAVPVSLPSVVLKRRPDVAAADMAMEASLARLGVARAAFFPQIKLTGLLGLETAELQNLLQLSSIIWSFGPSVSLPIFDGGQRRENYAAMEARLRQASAVYQSKVLVAFREVEDALSDLQWLASQSVSLEEALAAARDTARLARERYDRGLTNYLDAAEADRAVLETERSRVQLNGQQFSAVIALVKAVGGGWDERETRLTAQD